MVIPSIKNSTIQERKKFINSLYYCNGDCAECGVCERYGGQHPQAVFWDYIQGLVEYEVISKKYGR